MYCKGMSILIADKPTISAVSSSYPVREFLHLQINCSTYTTSGNPNLTNYSWSGPDAFNSSGPVLFFNSINRTQIGRYTCTASNTLTPTGGPPQTGTATGHFEVDVQYIPPVPTELLVWSNNSDTVLISWKTVSHKGAPYKFTVQYKDSGSQWIELDKRFSETGDEYIQGSITGLKAQTLYFVRVKSENHFGSSKFNREARILTKDSPASVASEIGSVSSTIMFGVGVSVSILGVLLLIVACLYVKIKGQKKRPEEHYASMEPKDNNAYDELNVHEYTNTGLRNEVPSAEVTTA